MSEHTAHIRWRRGDQDFLSGRYSRVHEIAFDGGATLKGSPAPSVVAPPMSDPEGVDPEEAFVAALSACHMLFFVSLAAKKRFVVDEYDDRAAGWLEKTEDGKTWMTKVELRPFVRFSGDRLPAAEDIAQIHHLAHEHCFIANSVKTEVTVAHRNEPHT